MNTTTPAEVRPAKVIRLIHGAMVAGIVIFAIVNALVIRPTRAGIELPRMALNVLLALSVAASVTGLLLRRRIPRRSTTDSEDLYWSTAMPPALITWAVIEAGALLGIVANMLYGAPAALGVAAIALLGLIVLNPGRLERASVD